MRKPLKHCQHFMAEWVGRHRFILMIGLMISGFGITSQAQISLNVTNFGMVGDAVQFYVNTVSNSVVVTTTNQVPISAVGDAIELFNCGAQTYGINSTNTRLYVRLLASGTQAGISAGIITNIINGTNIYILPNNPTNQSNYVVTSSLSTNCLGNAAIATSGTFQVYQYPFAYGNQDLIAVITNVANGTNVYIDRPSQQTITGTFATYGHDNSTVLQNAIQAAVSSGTNVTINIPAGKYLCLTRYMASAYANLSVPIYGGGFHLVGAGMTNTVLLGQGAWTMRGANATRGFLLAVITPVTNNYPVSFENLTLDGGVLQGSTAYHQFPANVVDGSGWDITHDAIDVRGVGSAFNHWTWTNLLFTHWRGEQVKSNDGSTNGNLMIVDCVFTDGNATAINIYPTLLVTNSVFTNMYQIAEYYQAYSTGTCYFVNNYVTNITGNGLAINGGVGYNPAFVIQGNSFNHIAGDGILTTPGDNVFIISNQFDNVGTPIMLGAPGYQSPNNSINSNIVVRGNSCINSRYFTTISGGVSSTDPTRVEYVEIFNNTVTYNGILEPLPVYQYTRNIHLYSNSFNVGANATFFSGNKGGQFPLIETNNNYWTQVSGVANSKTFLSYANGSRFKVVSPYFTNALFALMDTNAGQIPAGAQIIISNACIDIGFGSTIPVYLNSTLMRSPVMVGQGRSQAFQWTNGIWRAYGLPPGPPPPHAWPPTAH